MCVISDDDSGSMKLSLLLERLMTVTCGMCLELQKLVEYNGF